MAVFVVKQCGGIADGANGRDVFHVAPLDGFKANLDSGKGSEQSGFDFATKRHSVLPVAIEPSQVARFTESAGDVEELCFKLLALRSEVPDCCLRLALLSDFSSG